MRQLVRRFTEAEEGAGLTEYALIIALVAICLVGIVRLVRNAVGNTVKTTAAEVSKQSTSSYGTSSGPIGLPSLGSGSAPSAGDPDTDGEAEGEEEEEDGESADSASASPAM